MLAAGGAGVAMGRGQRGSGLSSNQRQRLLAVDARHVAHRRSLFADLKVNHRRDLAFVIKEDILGSKIAVDECHGALGPLAPRVDQPENERGRQQQAAENCNSRRRTGCAVTV